MLLYWILNFSLINYANEIKSDDLFVHDDKAFSYYAIEKIMKLLKDDNKEFNTVKDDFFNMEEEKILFLLIELKISLKNI